MFKIGKNFHVIHMTDDLQTLDAWYDDVFSVHRFMKPSYMEAEVRDASLVLIGNLCIEPLAPSFHVEGWDTMPLGRFYSGRGRRWHSIAWYLDSREGMTDLYHTLRERGRASLWDRGRSPGGGRAQGSPLHAPARYRHSARVRSRATEAHQQAVPSRSTPARWGWPTRVSSRISTPPGGATTIPSSW